MTPLEAFREYLRLSCKLSKSSKDFVDKKIVSEMDRAVHVLDERSQFVVYKVDQEFIYLEEQVEAGAKTVCLNGFRKYLRLSCELSVLAVNSGFGGNMANEIRDCMTIYWHRMQDSSREVCGLVNEEFNRLEAMK